MKLAKITLVVLATIASLPCHAQQSESDQAAIKRCQEYAWSVMKRIAAGDDKGALDLLRGQFPEATKQFEEVREKTLIERRKLPSKFGKVVDVRFVRQERVSDFLLRLTYVERRTVHLIRWEFVFYRANSEWRLNSYVWDENVAALFK
jgi:hypothetical protein